MPIFRARRKKIRPQPLAASKRHHLIPALNRESNLNRRAPCRPAGSFLSIPTPIPALVLVARHHAGMLCMGPLASLQGSQIRTIDAPG